jgi:hypothetical protein
MGLFSKKPSRPSEVRDALLPGGNTVDVVGESHYQAELEAIAGGKHEIACNLEKWAYLVREPDNPYDRNAVAVVIDDRCVGHLCREDTELYSALLDDWWERYNVRCLCRANIVGGWKRFDRDGKTVINEGHFGVELALAEYDDLLREQTLTILDPEDIAAGPGAPIITTPPPATSDLSPREHVERMPEATEVPAATEPTHSQQALTPPAWSESDGYQTKGVNGTLVVVPQGVIIKRVGAKAVLSQGRQPDQQIPIEDVASAQLKESTTLKNGYLYLQLHGCERKGGFDAARDSHAIMFTKKQQPAFQKAKELIDQYGADAAQPAPGPGIPEAGG